MQENQIIRFGPYHFEPHNAQLRRGTRVLPLTRKACEVLQCLVAQPGQLVTKEVLFQAVWPEMAVSDGVLTNCITELRQALGDAAKRPRFIATVHRRGYRFIAPLSPPAPAPSAASPAPDRASTPEPRPLAASLPAPHPAIPHLVGREAELAHLHRLYTDALHRQRHVVFVTGEAGIGKTALVETFVQGLRHDPGLWLGHGQCIEQYGAGEAYLPLLEALGRLCRGPGGERLVALLVQYAPSWVVQFPTLLSASALADLQHTLVGTTRERMLRELSVALDVVSAAQPLALVLEDLQWSDPSTIECLAMLARRREPARLLVLGTYRAAEAAVRHHPLATMKHELIARGQAVEVALSYLSPAAVDAYVTARIEDEGAAAALAPVVYRRTDGHPLFMVQVTDYLAQAGEPLMTTPTALGALEQALPPGLRELIEAQLGRLTAEEQQVLEVGSVAGAVFAVASVAAGLQCSDETIEAVCERLARRGQFLDERGLETWPDGRLSGRYGFRHALYQDVLYQRLGHGWQARLHRQMGEWQAHAYGERAREVAAELAVHFERGRDYQRAMQYRQQAAAQALGRYAYPEAIDHLTRGLALLQRLPETPVRAQQELDLQLALGPAMSATRGLAAPEVEQTYARARTLCQQIGDTPQLIPVLTGLRRLYFAQEAFQATYEVGMQLFSLAQESQDHDLLVEAHQALGLTLLMRGQAPEALIHLRQGTAYATPGQRATHGIMQVLTPAVVCLSYTAWALWLLGFPDQARSTSASAIRLAQADGSPMDGAHALCWDARLQQFCRDCAAAAERAAEALALSTAHGLAHYRAYSLVYQGWAFACLGQETAGLGLLQQGQSACQAAGPTQPRAYFLALLAEVYGVVGRAEEGLHLLEDAQALVEATHGRWWEAELYRLKGELLLVSGSQSHVAGTATPDTRCETRDVQAAAYFDQALTLARCQQARSWELRAATSLARLWQHQGKRDDARTLLAPLYNWFTEGFDTADLQEARALLEALS